MNAPELASIDAFGDYLLSDDRTSFTFDEAVELAASIGHGVPVSVIRALLQAGFTMEPRPVERHVRGYRSNNHDRWSGLGSSPTFGGSGSDQIFGMAGDPGAKGATIGHGKSHDPWREVRARGQAADDLGEVPTIARSPV